jgi:hypothetical protein
LESKAVMSADIEMAPIAATAAAHHGDVARDPPDLVTDAATIRTRRVALSGEAEGFYASTQGTPDAGTEYLVNATGTITGVGAAAISGSFRIPWLIHGRRSSGALTIVGSPGTLKLRLKATGAGVANVSMDGGDRIGPGAAIGRASPSISSIPIILLNDFRYTITGGTGRFAHARGSGTVLITTTPGPTGPTGPGIYSTAATPVNASGRATLTFR